MKTKIVPVLIAVLCLVLCRMPAAGDTGAHCFVAESGTGTIYDYATNGTRTVYATNVGLPFGLAFDSASNLFVADHNGYIYKIGPNKSKSTFASPYNSPTGMAVDSSNNLYVGFLANGYIFQYAPDGTRTIFGQEPYLDAYYNYGRPVGLAFNRAGTLFESDSYYGLLYKGVPSLPFATATNAYGLAFDSRSNLFVADSVHGRIYEYANLGGSPSSAFTIFATNMTGPTGLAIDSNDNLFVADYSAGKIYKYATNGVQTTFASGLQYPTAVAFLPVSQPASPPPLVASFAGSNMVVSWKNTGTYTLQHNTNLSDTNNWTTGGYAITSTNGTNSITITLPTGNLFFRLTK